MSVDPSSKANWRGLFAPSATDAEKPNNKLGFAIPGRPGHV